MKRNEPREKRKSGEVKGPGKSKTKSFGDETEKAPREEPRGAFVFTDRSGKSHALVGRERFAPKEGARSAPSSRPGGPQGPRDSRDARGPKPSGKGPGKGHAKGGRGPQGERVESSRFSRPERAAYPKSSRPDHSKGPRKEHGAASSSPEKITTRPGRADFSEGARPRARDDDRPRFAKKGPRNEDRPADGKRRGRGGEGHRGGGKKFGEKFAGRGGKDRQRSEPRKAADGDFKLKARIDKNRKGFAFLQFETKEFEDAFLNPFEAERFFHGDRVEAIVSEDGDVVEIKILEHRFREVFGRFYQTGKTGMVVYERKKAREELIVVGDTMGAKTRDWVRGTVIYPEGEEGGRITCQILQTFGEELPPSADIQMVSAEYNLIEEHSPEAVAEAESFTLDLDDPHREDLRHVPFITIDGETARDFDDAVYVERNREGGYVLWVAIADVSHYVQPGTALNDEALSRGTSVYFPERAFHMLPRALSENLCSLRPDGPRLTMTSKITYDRNGEKKSVEVMNSLIQSHRRATYNEIQAEADANVGNADWEFRTHYDLYAILRRKKRERGSIDFDLPEAEVKVEPTGEPISIKNRPRLDAHRLIEEFMIAANESVTEWALERQWPFVYRIHDEPARQAIVKFQELCAHYEIPFRLDEANLADSLNQVIQSIAGHPAQIVLNMALLRSMAQAHYSPVHGIHFGLASEAYTHFTSPIRRYPDLVVHRMLKLALEFEREKKRLSDVEREEIEQELAEITEHCSYRERLASDAERESIKLKQARIMMPEIGNEFDAKVNGMLEAGLFASINDPFVEGFISQETMTDDFYSYNEERQLFIGRRTKKTYRVGDPIRVRVDRVDLDLRRIELSLAEGTETSPEKE